MTSDFQFQPSTLKDLIPEFQHHGVSELLIKPLKKNHNDKNQIYSGTDFRPLFPIFDMSFSFRGPSTSAKKNGRNKNRPIPEAVFSDFSWATVAGGLERVPSAKMIVYPQYPETRLSGFQTNQNEMPPALSVSFTKQALAVPRYLVLGRRGAGAVVAFMVVDPGAQFRDDVEALPHAPGSRSWKHFKLKSAFNTRLFQQLAISANTTLPGCRLTAEGKTVPFNGTQVCGYTLEHALDLRPNSSKFGDFEGIELKTHTQKKVTLFTPEPDMGLYHDDFGAFMTEYGYEDRPGQFRLTGVHKVDVPCAKTGLTLKVINHTRGETLAAKADSDVHVGLVAPDGALAAGWSLERILNSWNAKHNEAVYIAAAKSPCKEEDLLREGYKFTVRFHDRVMWCRDTSAEQLFEALYNGTLFLDPAPKYCPANPKLNKRRSQWRVNDIAITAKDLYTHVEFVDLKEARS
jgi:hypothetical protein